MKYSEFYEQANDQLIESLSNMWFRGHPDALDHFKQMVGEREPLLSEPVFQTIFPWRNSECDFLQHATRLGILEESFVRSLDSVKDEDYRFPLDRYPYSHQTESWARMLDKNDRKTIIVTSGTGSGKTECFMIPVLQDLLQNKKDGIQAIFLYPLNALMNDQQKRIDEWCKAVSPQIRYAIYNGDTPESVSRAQKTQAYPQLICREDIRNNPPQVLFTNPTLLNYMLVRKSDQPIIEKSRANESLRWILLDEAHTYTGSAATELALQIRRVLDAFGIDDLKKINFAVTSATISSNDPQAKQDLISMVARLTGKDEKDIVIIEGDRVIPHLDQSKVTTAVQQINSDYGLSISRATIDDLRLKLNTNPALSLSEISEAVGLQTADRKRQLDLVDLLGDKIDGLNINGKPDALLPTRMHLFIRAINGIFTCSNSVCPSGIVPKLHLGELTTYQEANCPNDDCKSPMLEVVRCGDCGGLLIIGEEDQNGYHMRINQRPDDVDLFEDLDDDDSKDITGKSLFIVGMSDKPCPRHNVETNYVYFNARNRCINRSSTPGSGYFTECLSGDRKICPHCGKTLSFKDLKSFCVGAPFMGRTLSRLILEQAEHDTKNTDVVHGGQKYITFTDSRSGTAKSAMHSNMEVERNWIRGGIFQILSDKRRDNYSPGGLDKEDQEELDDLAAMPSRRGRLQARYEELIEKAKGGEPDTVAMSWKDLFQRLDPDRNSALLFQHIADARKRNISKWGTYQPGSKDNYMTALMINQFGRIPRRENSLETLGLVHPVYPQLKNVTSVPAQLAGVFNIDEWRTFLKICVDYFIRENYHYTIPTGAGIYLVQDSYTSDIYGPTCSKEDKKKWPQLVKENDKFREPQNRIITLLCATLGYDDIQNISDTEQTRINEILKEAWRVLKTRVLIETDTISQNSDDHGYKLDLTNGDKVKFELMTDGWICPVDHVIVDCKLKDFSPRLKGYINPDNIERYRIHEPSLHYAFFPYANHRKLASADRDMAEVTTEEITQWIEDNWKEQKARGQFSDIIQSIIENRKIFLTAEHSAQLSSEIRENSVVNFKKGLLNVLACSTTMEMGVDLSGITEVVMNTVPPKPANYLQRAGRAGRRSESKAMALTFCSSTPVGNMAWENPMWPMTHPIKMPSIKMESHAIIQKHLNSAFFSLYVKSLSGLRITTTVADFFDTNTCDDFLTKIDDIRLYVDPIESIEWEKTKDKITVDTILEQSTFDERLLTCKDELIRVRDVYNTQVKMMNDSLAVIPNTSPAYNAVLKRLNSYKDQKILTFLSENGFLPSAGMPIGLVEFVTGHPKKSDKEEYRHDSYPSKHISQAISEYAPGNQIVINEWCYESAGIGMKNSFADTDRYIIQQCTKCKYTSVHRGTPLKECPCCHGKDTMKGVWDSTFTEIIEPVSFTVDYNASSKRKLETTKMGFTRPMLLRMQPWSQKSKGAKCVIRSSDETNSSQMSEILFYNAGANGRGYAYCPYCGRVESEPSDGQNLMDAHKRIDSDQVCDGNGHVRNNVLLVGRYQTDFVEIKIYDQTDTEITDQATLYSLGVVFCRKLSEILGINDGEIGFGLNNDFGSIFIYDTAIGGAGYSTLFRDYKDIVFDEALNFLKSCSCNCACTKCLIDRQTQWHIDNLDRNKAIAWLELEAQSRQASPFALSHFPDAKSLTCDISGEICHLINSNNVDKVQFFIDSDTSQWNLSHFKYHKILKEARRKDISYVLDKSIDFSSLDSANLAQCVDVLMDSVEFESGTINKAVVPLMMVTFSDGKRLLYFGENNPIGMNAKWGEGNVFYAEYTLPFNPSGISKLGLIQNLHSSSVAMHYSVYDSSIPGKDLLNTLITASAEPSKWNRIFSTVNGKSVDVEFNDKHLNSPMACYILCCLIKQCKEKFNLTINSVTLNLEGHIDDPYYKDHTLEQHFQSWNDQESVLNSYFQTHLGITPVITRTPIYQHERDLIFTGPDFQFVILPNGGINWGWKIDRRAPENANLLLPTDLAHANAMAVLFNYKRRITFTITLK